MENILDIKCTVNFGGSDGVTYEVLDSVLLSICKDVHNYERKELNLYLKFLTKNNVNKVTQDAIEHRFSKIDKRRSISVVEARTGSIEVALTLAAVAYWVVDKTLGETLKEAWLTSELHFKLVNFLKERTIERKNQMEKQEDLVFLKKVDGVQISYKKEQDKLTVDVTTQPEAAPIPGVKEIFTR